ncbi:class I SAM-dependent methyltransferase [Marinobacter sp. SS21]|uniref:class I SAM-dependent methyltransferase n=1 Tax=Marinobacter sp. SS21 TaxID=2979460 RepID=UPI00232DFB26|nr:class I SAM-dependent methyltransferase [Marinobacter sp. SS21]MDC0662115.1 class I SAM-dependent methyltransferase [Marinobacter sp. SS21]
MSLDRLHLNHVDLALSRPGARGRGLQAWDAADELLIEAARARLQPGQRVAIVDDSFGALSLALADHQPAIIADSAVLDGALAHNAGRNGIAAGPVSSWQGLSAGPFDLLVLRIPRQLEYLEYLLRWANDVLAPGGVLLAGGMIKHLPNSSVEVFARLVTTEEVLPARKKARVVVCRAGSDGLAHWPALWRGYTLAPEGLPLQALPAVFARDRLDIGASVLLPWVREQVAGLATGARVLDLACGNGVQGIAAMAQRPDLDVSFADVSSQAVLSCQRNVATHFGEHRAHFYHGDGIVKDAGDFDLILLNPPFHEAGVVGDHIALRLFRQAAEQLRPGGRLLVVGNRHLGYHKTLRRDFSQVRQLDANPKFVVFEACHEPGRS